MSEKIIIKDFYGRITGSIEILPNGDKIVRDFYGKIKGKYDIKNNVTRDFYGRVVAKGDQASALITLNLK